MNLRDKKVLVTGADGFIGSHLTEMLIKDGVQVRALACYNSFNNWGWLEDIPKSALLEIVSGDIRDAAFCRHLSKDINVVFHLAALIAIPYSYLAPQSYVETNVLGTLNICQAAMDNGIQRIIHTSTSEVYGTANYIPIDEKHPLQPQSPYSASKIAADAMAMSFYNAFNLPLIIARPFNTFGPRQSARAIIPTIISQLASGSTELKLGDLSPTRDLNYVEDTCRGFIELAQTEGIHGETVNIGSGSEISIGDLAGLIMKIMDHQIPIAQESQRLRPEKSEVRRLYCDNSKIRKLTGFQPQVSLEEGLKKTINWFTRSENLVRYKAGIYNV